MPLDDKTDLAPAAKAPDQKPDLEAPRSQAAIDLETLAGDEPPEEPAKAAAAAPPPPKARTPRFRWMFLLVLSLAGTAGFCLEAFLGDLPYRWLSLAILAAALVLGLGLARFLRPPTRAGLAALVWALAFFLAALYGPSETMFGAAPAGFSWAAVLTLAILWLLLAIRRRIKRRHAVALVLAAIIVYGALGPVAALVRNLVTGRALALNFTALSAHPAVLTEHLPWMIWPMAVAVFALLPLAAIFALWDQAAVLKRPADRRHAGNIFLALAFLLLMPYGFLSFDAAVAAQPGLAATIRSAWPPALEYARENAAGPLVLEEAATSTPATEPFGAIIRPEFPPPETPAAVPPADELIPPPPQPLVEESAPLTPQPPVAKPAPPASQFQEPAPVVSPPAAGPEGERLQALEEAVSDLREQVRGQGVLIEELRRELQQDNGMERPSIPAPPARPELSEPDGVFPSPPATPSPPDLSGHREAT